MRRFLHAVPFCFVFELMPGSDTGTNAVNRPLEGVTITIEGMEESLRAKTGGWNG